MAPAPHRGARNKLRGGGIPLPAITLRWQWCGLQHGEQALNVSALFVERYVSCCISSGRQLPVGKYFCEFLGVPPAPTGKGLCLSRQPRSCAQPYWGSSETIWCPCLWKVIQGLCPKGKPPCAGSTFMGKVALQKTKLSFFISW